MQRASRVAPAPVTLYELVLRDGSRAYGTIEREDGSVIPGLYASGGAAAGISGHGAAGYLAGNGLLPALGLADLAADHAALLGSTTHHTTEAHR